MQNYKEVCGNEKEIWFEIRANEYKKFLNWAKSLGCVWINGDEINVKEKITSFHYSIDSNGILSKVGDKLTIGQIGKAYSQHVKKTSLPFKFEGMEIPSSIGGRYMFSENNIYW